MAKKAMRTPGLSDLHPAEYNPRIIQDDRFDALSVSLREFGDISGITWNERTGNLVSGHQRLRSLKDQHGEGLKMSRGVIETPGGERFTVRVVDWPIEKERAANIAANNPFLSGRFTTNIEQVLAEIEAVQPDYMSSLAFDDLLAELGFDADFDVGTVADQGALDIIKPTICPKCGHEFHASK